ncbi:MAG: hypothetical protein L0Y72_04140 [Gemmataceae bacterium]|nr:hypothetical protein [Gemmataceae bacterium]
MRNAGPGSVLVLGIAFWAVVAGTNAQSSACKSYLVQTGDQTWLRPAADGKAEPVWGIPDGLAIGLWPTSGPRGLIRIYAPYLGHKRPRMVNYISIEPVVRGSRGQSELEKGALDKKPGLAMWTADSLAEAAGDPKTRKDKPAHGRVTQRGGADALTFYLATELFRNGARPIVQVILRTDRPNEVGFRVYAAKDSAPMDSCVLSATMGNYGRLRHLWLKGAVADARKVWPTFQPDRLGFAPWRTWPRERMLKIGGDLIVAATTDESDPAGASYEPMVPAHWRYQGKPATHYWCTKDSKGAVVRVNGRSTFWGEQGKIPGGVSYENFQLEVPFAEGHEFRFGVTPEAPSKLGFDAAWKKRLTAGK